jgi:hypothetical protein
MNLPGIFFPQESRYSNYFCELLQLNIFVNNGRREMRKKNLACIFVFVGMFVFLTNNAYAQDGLKVDSTGNVGIGTATPGSTTWNNKAKLDVKSDGGGRTVLAISSSDDQLLGGFYQDWDTSGNLFIKDANSNNKVNIQAVGDSFFTGGNIGIGTTTPGSATWNGLAKLDVKSDGIGRYVLAITSSDGQVLGGFYEEWGTSGTISIRDAGGNNKVNIRSSGDSYFNGGNIGIGTTNQFGGGDGVLAIGNAQTNPIGTLVNAALFYVSDGEMYAYDAEGNSNPISSHPSSEIEALAEPDDPYPLFQKATSHVIGKEIVIDKGKAFRLLQTLFPDEQFIWYRDVSKVDVEQIQRDQWKQNWIAENTTEIEVSKSDAFETVEVEVDDESNVIGEKVRYILEGEDVIEIREPLFAKNIIEKRQLKENARFDTDTGKFFMKKKPDEVDAAAAASKKFQFKVKKWVKARLKNNR